MAFLGRLSLRVIGICNFANRFAAQASEPRDRHGHELATADDHF
jgi:hypothetical protein